ncbi:tetratricopeptide repeat protein [Burkholderiaceae bacterium DAT-1]|nr:tetratricopeptide repeat protein [Burkholderiaceae bacterium DAT-1]
MPALMATLLMLPAMADEAGDIASLISKGEPREAVERADAALAKAPRDARIRFLKACGLADLGKANEAIQAFLSLTKDYPNLPEPYNNLAALYAQQGQLDRARQALQMAIQTNPAYATAHANLADVYSRLAAQAYDKALQIDRGSSSAGAQQPKLALVRDLYSRNTIVASNNVTPPPSPTTVIKPSPAPAAVQPPAPAPSVAPSVSATKPATPTPTPTLPPVAAAKPKPKPSETPAVTGKPSAVTPAPTPAPPPAATAQTPQPAKPEAAHRMEQDIVHAVNAWADAWESKKVSAYLAYYSKSFKPAGMSRTEWEKQRRERIEGARKIVVKVSGVKVKIEGDRATVHFVQKYRSDRLDTSTGKTLVLERIGDRWLIREERVG